MKFLYKLDVVYLKILKIFSKAFTYQCVSRDSLGLAMKATYCEVNGESREIFKDPKTVTSTGMTKKSLRGLIKVYSDSNNNLIAQDGVSKEEEKEGKLIPYFKDGKQLFTTELNVIRRLRTNEIKRILDIE